MKAWLVDNSIFNNNELYGHPNYGKFNFMIVTEDNRKIVTSNPFELYTIKKKLNLNILNIENDYIEYTGEFHFATSWKFNNQDINDLCNRFNAKAKLLGMHIECRVDTEHGGCTMYLLDDTFIPEQIPDWINRIEAEGLFEILNKRVKLGKAVYFLGEHVFESSPRIEEIECNDLLGYIGRTTFESMSNLKKLSLYKPFPDIVYETLDYSVIPDILEIRTPNYNELHVKYNYKLQYNTLILNEKLKNFSPRALLRNVGGSSVRRIEFKSFE